MELKEVYYQESYQVGDFLYRHYGARVVLNNGDTEDMAWDFAQKTTAERFRKDNPQIKWSDGETVIQVKKTPEPPQSTEAKIIAQINSCTDITVLKTFEKLSKTYPTVKAAYEQQFQTLKQ